MIRLLAQGIAGLSGLLGLALAAAAGPSPVGERPGTSSDGATRLAGTWGSTRANGDQSRDVFQLSLLVRGEWVCGQVMGTTHGATSIDSSHVVGHRDGAVLHLGFASQHDPGAVRGAAEVRRDGRALAWRAIRPIDVSDLWSTARLTAGRPDPEAHRDLVRWCATRWATLREGRGDTLDLRP